MNASIIFMNLINWVFTPYLNKFIIVSIDDIMVYSKTEEDHVRHLRIVLETLKKEKLCGKLSNCTFWLKIILFMGHIVSGDRISVDPNKISVVNIGPSKNERNVKSFMNWLVIIGSSCKTFLRL